MGLMNVLERLLREAGEAYLDEIVPASKPKKSASGSRRKTSSKKTASAVKKPAVRSARRKKSRTTSHSATVYTDQAILSNPFAAFTPVPQQIRQMRTFSGYSNLDGTRSIENLFYQQGKFMEQYTDDYPESVQCDRSIPMYYNMKDHELRAYFTWRTRYRQGALPPAQNAFLLLYAYEILNLIGFPTAELAYDALGNLLRDYGGQFPAVKKSLLRWTPDFAAYYRLPYRLDYEKEAAAITVLRHSAHTAEELLLALDQLSKYHIKDSKLYLAEKQKVAELLKAVYQAMLTYYAEQKGQSFSAYLLGEQKREQHIMFEGAMFCYRTPQKDGSYRLSPLCVYHCCKGQWATEKFCSTPHTDRVGALLRTFDSFLREKLKFKNKLKAGEMPEGDAEIIRQTIDAWFVEQERKNAPVITLNPAELAEIRKAAAHTTDMLTLPEDQEPEPTAAAAVPEPINDDEEADDSEIPDLPLSKPAMALLICLVTGESYQPLIDAGQMISVLVDEINENLYDSFGDTIIEMQDDETPVLIADYLDDVKGMLET